MRALIVLGLIVLGLIVLAGCATTTAAPYYWCQPLVVQGDPGLLCVPVKPPKAGTPT